MKKHDVKIPVTLGPNCTIDLSEVDVTPEMILEGHKAYNSKGELITGTLVIPKNN